ncbi:MAG: hypothetical protein H6669_08190 [Ardenticatenaceae bacterium]|nr:hypothetical protein [Ardenticatenaceae bacterium]
MKKVTSEYTKGIPAMLNLVNMIGKAISEAIPDVKVKRTGGWSWRGYYFDDSLWCGVRYERPLIIEFQNDRGYDPTYRKTLNLNDNHFFSLTQGEQFESLIKFLQQAYQAYKEEQNTQGV